MSAPPSTGPAPVKPPAAAPAPGPGAPGGVVVGDGTTLRSRAARRWRASGWFVLVGAVVIVVMVALALIRTQPSGTPLAPDNPGPDGTQALARILEDHGVQVTYTRSVDDAVRAAREDTTLLVLPGPLPLTDHEATSLAGAPATTVVVAPDDSLLAAAAPGVEYAYGWSDTLTTARSGPDCVDPDAMAAGEMTTGGYGFEVLDDDPGTQVCFPLASTPRDPMAGSLVVLGEGGGDESARTVLVDDPTFLTNGHLASVGNAALAVRLLGRHPHLVWLLPDLGDDTQDTAAAGPGLFDLLPPGSGWVALWALVVAAFAIWWRGRRLGALVPEDLPVVVRSSEATLGRARLYRAGRSRGHAGAGLRAAAAERLARTLGVPRSAEPASLVAAVAQSSGRAAADVADLLYGPPPPDDAALVRLAQTLDDLEKEVRP